MTMGATSVQQFGKNRLSRRDLESFGDKEVKTNLKMKGKKNHDALSIVSCVTLASPLIAAQSWCTVDRAANDSHE